MVKNYTRDFKFEVCKLVVEDNLKPIIVAEKFAMHCGR